jgi:phage/plasmid-associated DNA primase
VLRASERYRIERDPVATFLKEEVESDPKASPIGAAALYDAFVAWCREQAIEPKSMTLFGSLVGQMFERRETKQGNQYLGARLRRRPGGGVEGYSQQSSKEESIEKVLGNTLNPPPEFVNVDHEPVEDDWVPEPTLKDLREQNTAHIAAYVEER